ncbi:MAG: class C beta-lactamase-related serine hydrolase [Chitinophagaceae bacterium]|nr:MAG: class C beta-lactamase-related serine hydrolase [Chitinophagaceae bacterium]
MKRKRILPIVLAGLLLIIIYYTGRALPVATGYAAKTLGSGIFLSGRDKADIDAKDLNFFPVKNTRCEINTEDSSVTCSLLGLASVKAIYRHGLGVTLINDLSESEVRAQNFPIATRPALVTDTIAWPVGDLLPDSLSAAINSATVNAAIEKLFAHNEVDTPIVNITRALVVLYDGQIIAERYAQGYNRNTKLTGWSMTKSLTSALIGLLVKEGRLQLDGPAPVPEWKDPKDPRHEISVRHLLQQTNGLDFDERYDIPADANRMLFVKGDAAAFTAEHPLKNKPGTDFRYSSGNTNILSRIIRQVTGENNYHSFPYNALFHKLGMYNTILEPDASGTFVGSSFCYATARDWARFGLLYLNNGRVNGEYLLPENWVKESITPSSAAETGEYGFQWWLNAGAPNNSQNRSYPALPEDMFYADGYEGQNIFILPSSKLVVVRLGLTKGNYWGEVELLRSLIQSIDPTKKNQAASAN